MTTTTNALDALLYIRDGSTTARWNFPDAVGGPLASPAGIGHSVSLTYSFLTATPAYFLESTLVAFDSTQKQATRDVLALIAEVVGVKFVEVSGVGQMTFAMSSQAAGQGGYAYSPSYSYSYSGATITSVTEQGVAGDVWLNRNAGWKAEDWQPGHNGHLTLIHEIGHALGLKHSFASTQSGYTLVSSLEDESHTVMSYARAPHSRLISVSGTAMNYSWQESFLRPSTLMPLDITALQYLYGANTATRSGNDVYQWSPNAELLATIWDSGGVDTIDCSNQTLTCVIDLRAGNYSSIAYRQTDAELRLGLDLPSWFTQPLPSDIYDGSNNLAIAPGVVIEKAFGGMGNDRITGNDANNTLNGGGGNDSIFGGLGSDSIDGGSGNDTIDGGSGIDSMVGGDGNDIYYVRDVGDIVIETNASASIGGTDTVYSYLASYTLGTNVENGRILATGAANLTGNSLNNVLYAGAGNNALDGSSGTDTASYVYATAAVKVSLAVATAQATGGSGSDTLVAIENLTGSTYADTLTGNAGANVLDGGAGIDTMLGGDGNDIYYVRDVGDIVIETNASASIGGTDTVYSYLASYTLGANVENGRILATGAANLTGNSLNNVLYAGAGNNVLDGSSGTDTASYAYATAAVKVSLAVATAQATGGSGSDTLVAIENLTGSTYADTLTGNAGANVLDGGAGIDTMLGGDGSDIYYVRDVGDIVIETNASASSGGSDTVYSYLASYTLGANVENGRVVATGTANLTGNTLANVLYAGAGNNVLDGSSGTDTASYKYATAGVTVSLAVAGAQATGGSASDTLTLIENLTGSKYNDTLTGDAGANVINGGAGNDTLSGGLGCDIIRFDSVLDALTNSDTIVDFNVLDDTIQLENAIFTSLTTLGILAADFFRSGAGVSSAADANDFVLYDSTSGALRYDPDGSGVAAAVQFATLSSGLALSNADFLVT
ncbi:matrixin family metalloprotease [Candidatus Accumulibacter sp. ACC003]|uniref:matrixin family metalloprotease n=1 Tax=Candidatus Accumulibacter sp. ACC003 TaxID=2823334 RepID=UPI0025BC8F5C|nr:matrixin family metalloprotease [Candidatus Accumulibacter sp. ACC003]